MTTRISNMVFFPPKTVFTDNQEDVAFVSSRQITDLFKDVQKSLLVAYGYFGPSAYTAPPLQPFKLDHPVGEFEVFGWKEDAARRENPKTCSAMVLGGIRGQKGGVIFYALSKDVTSRHYVQTRKHEPSTKETRIFTASLKSFGEAMIAIYATKKIITSFDEKITSKALPILPDKETIFMAQLASIKLEYFDQAEMQYRVRALGERIFDYFKTKADSREAMRGMRRIVECMPIYTDEENGLKKMKAVERIWQGIGDEDRYWQDYS